MLHDTSKSTGLFPFKGFLTIFLLLLSFISSAQTDKSITDKYPKLKELKADKLLGDIYPSEKNGKWGYVNDRGKFVIKPVFESAEKFNDSLAIIKYEGLYGIINRRGTYTHYPTYKDIVPISISDKLVSFIFYDEKGKGIMSSEADVIVPPLFEEINPLITSKLESYIVSQNRKKGIITPNGKNLLPIQYDSIVPTVISDKIENYVLSKNGKKGIISKDGVFQLKTIYDEITLKRTNEKESVFYYLTKSNNRYGYASYDFKFVCEPQFLETPNPTSNPTSFFDGNNYFIISTKSFFTEEEYDNNQFKNLSYDSYVKDERCIPLWRKNHVLWEKMELRISKDLSLALKKYDEIYNFSEGLARVKYQEKYGFININGEEVIPCVYSGAYDFSCGLARVDSADIHEPYFINKKGKSIKLSKLNVKVNSDFYESGSHEGDFHEGFAVVADMDEWGFTRKYGYINVKGELAIPCIFGEANEFINGIAFVKDEHRRYEGCINTKGEQVIPCKYDVIFRPDNPKERLWNVSNVTSRGIRRGFVDISDGRLVIPLQHDWVLHFSEGRIWLDYVVDNSRVVKYALVDEKGTRITQPIYYDANPFSEGLASVRIENKWFFVNKNGTIAIEPKCDRYGEHISNKILGSFHEGLAFIRCNNKYGYIDKNGVVKIQCKYDYVGDFENGVAKVEINGKSGVIDKNGKTILPCKYQRIDMTKDGIVIQYNEKYGFSSWEGVEIFPCISDIDIVFSNGIALIKNESGWGYIDKYGNCTIDYQ